ncbi:hypothetical protein AvCA_35440 [Azotobacter vinelandii CA]|uniref:DUF3016 domain-containing protein n=2 Tax=Azotobacter vinelandii TaxID=354 RepID=C1DR35_AZOVD|nr:DUF3016 domain-containing protein [Azotobacter vinelandii]ACO79693.1 conserved hypothetical protein [Azotobacter vinelandii DJ]AGK14603.1 hypothetical protein AvCA_35440 [Azotobacter vinelandii CA]AGK21421.1 hypothetical protein AvCA6_35440 [Azotobacter vinelandii CA6]WKN20547.1 DUF3016 domain-containing protein [Azotobacter vinelandii]SFX23677.1 Protein of unknown function [Azotobacter vinelandii]
MRSILFAALTTLDLAVGGSRPIAAEPRVTVEFTQPENFRDATLSGRHRGADERVLNELRTSFEYLGERYLAPGLSLHVEVTDIDLAGRHEPWWRSQGYDMRVMREIDWPSINLNYELRRNGTVIASEKARITDPSYLQHPGRHGYGIRDPLYAEKYMLDLWFRQRFIDR